MVLLSCFSPSRQYDKTVFFCPGSTVKLYFSVPVVLKLYFSVPVVLYTVFSVPKTLAKNPGQKSGQKSRVKGVEGGYYAKIRIDEESDFQIRNMQVLEPGWTKKKTTRKILKLVFLESPYLTGNFPISFFFGPPRSSSRVTGKCKSTSQKTVAGFDPGQVHFLLKEINGTNRKTNEKQGKTRKNN